MKHDYNKKYNVGDVIYPFYNGTLGFFKTPIWSVVVKVNKKGNWKTLKYWYDNETAELHSMFLRLIVKQKKEKKK